MGDADEKAAENGADDRAEETEKVSRMLRKEISQAADLLIKVQHAKAGSYAASMAEAASKHGNHEDHEFWKRIAREVEKRLAVEADGPVNRNE